MLFFFSFNVLKMLPHFLYQCLENTYRSILGQSQMTLYLQHSKQHELHVLISSPCPPSPTGAMQSGPGGRWACSEFASQLRSPKFRVPESFIMNSSKSAQFLPWREPLSLLYNSKQTCLLLYGNTMSSTAVHYTNLLGKDSVEKTKAVRASAPKMRET